MSDYRLCRHDLLRDRCESCLRDDLASARAEAASLREQLAAMEVTDRVCKHTIRTVSTQRDVASVAADYALSQLAAAESQALASRDDARGWMRVYGRQIQRSADYAFRLHAAEAERDELRGRLRVATDALEVIDSPIARRTLHALALSYIAHPAIPEGTPGEGKP